MLELCLESALISPCLRATRLYTNRLWRQGVQPQTRSAPLGNFWLFRGRTWATWQTHSIDAHKNKKRLNVRNPNPTLTLTESHTVFEPTHKTKTRQVRNWYQLSKGTPCGIQRQTGRDLARAAGMVKDVLCWETPGESYAEAIGLSSIALQTAEIKAPGNLEQCQCCKICPEEHSVAQKQACEAVC